MKRLLTAGIALAIAGTLGLSGCSSSTTEATRQTGEAVGGAVKEGANAVGDAAKTAASATGQAALTPVLKLLNKSNDEVKAGNLTGAIASMGGFSALWATAGPVVKPLAGDKWPIIDTAARLALSTFEKGKTPTAANASSAITGLLGPLSALLK
jgi:hypothetical protein